MTSSSDDQGNEIMDRRLRTLPDKIFDRGDYDVPQQQQQEQQLNHTSKQLDVADCSAEVPTIGSALHSRGECRPCGFFWKPSGCHFGPNCHYCHLCPEGELKARKKAKLALIRSGNSSEEITAGAAGEASDKTVSRTKVPLADLVKPPEGFLNPLSAASPRSKTAITSTAEEQMTAATAIPMCHAGNVIIRNTFIEVVDVDTFPQEAATRRTRRARTEPVSILSTAGEDDDAELPNLLHARTARARTQEFESLLDNDATSASCYSFGSSQHGEGNCRPCAWFWRLEGCRNGADCRHCHLCPQGELKLRRKDKIATMRKEREVRQF
jgi:hypothetical protein